MWCGVGIINRGQTVLGLVQMIGGGEILRTERFSAGLGSNFVGKPGPGLGPWLPVSLCVLIREWWVWWNWL